MKHTPEYLAKRLHPFRLPSDRIEGARDIRRRQGPFDQSDVIVPMNPRHPLGPWHDRAAQIEVKWEQHLRQRPAVAFEDHSGPQEDHTSAKLGSPLRFFFPCD